MFRNPAVDLLVVLLIALLIFGPKRLPTLGRSLGQGLREFKDSITGDSKDEDEDRPQISQATSAQPAPAQSAPAHPASPERESAEVGSPSSETRS